MAACDSLIDEPHETVEINKQNFFEPGSIAITKGQKVAWKHRGTDIGAVVCVPAEAPPGVYPTLPEGAEVWASPDLYPGQQWTYTFATLGTYIYFNRYFPQHTASVIVLE